MDHGLVPRVLAMCAPGHREGGISASTALWAQGYRHLGYLLRGLWTPSFIHVELLSWESSKCPIDNTEYRGCGSAVCDKEPLVKMLSISVLDFHPSPHCSGLLTDSHDTEEGPAFWALDVGFKGIQSELGPVAHTYNSSTW